MRCSLFLLTIIILSFTSCHKNDSIDIRQDRDTEIDVSELIEEFPVEDVLIHDGALFCGSDSYLYIDDYMSTDKILTVFSLPDGKYIGQYMNFGEGPNEVSMSRDINIVTSAMDKREKSTVLDFIHHRVYTYDVDSALNDSLYIPLGMKPLDATVFPTNYVYVNDTLGFARKIMLRPGNTRFQQALGKYNLLTGELTDFAPEEHIDGNYSSIAVSKDAERVIEAGANVDMVIIYDYAGNVIRRIKGSNYKPEADGRKIYYSYVKVGGPYIFGVYSGGDWHADQIGKKIVVMDLDGNYIATLDTGKRIRDIYYHAPSGVLWLSFYQDDMQFGKLNLEEALKKNNKEQTVNTVIDTSETKKETASIEMTESPEIDLIFERFDFQDSTLTGTFPPIVLTSKSLMSTLTRWDMGEIFLPKERDELYVPYEHAPTIKSKKFYIDGKPTGRDVRIWIESIKVTPDFIKGEMKDNFESRNVTLLNLGFTKNAPEGKFDGMVEVCVKGFSKPLSFPISGTIVYE